MEQDGKSLISVNTKRQKDLVKYKSSVAFFQSNICDHNASIDYNSQ